MIAMATLLPRDLSPSVCFQQVGLPPFATMIRANFLCRTPREVQHHRNRTGRFRICFKSLIRSGEPTNV